MNSIILSLNVAIPLAGTIFTGYFFRQFKLLMLGAGFRFVYLNRYRTQLMITVVGKLIIVPAAGYAIAIAAGYREAVLLSLGAMFMSPVASSSYNMAEAMGGDGDFAGTVVVSTSVLSVVTIFLWVFLLSSFGMI